MSSEAKVNGHDAAQKQSGVRAKKSKVVSSRQFKLISVNFKEAALDSPSFRATVNHLDLQIENIEQWLIALTSSCRKIPKFLNDIQSFYNSFLEHLVPSFLQDGLIDQEYTVQSLQTSLAGLKRLWGFSLSALHINAIAIENLNSVISSNISHYKELRKRYDLSQMKYEKFLKTYVSTSKSKDPAMVLEDAAQLYSAKQEYIHTCLDLITELATLGNSLDRLLVKVSTSLWKNKRMSISESQDLYFEEAWSKISKIQAWSDSYSVAMDKLKSDMVAARMQVEESSNLQMRPSTNLNDYKSSLLNANVLADIDESSFEKHGYLFMKTSTQTAKPIWVRRWVFIKGGVFGMLILSPSKTFVQETDKIGVLLCNVKYYPSEDRRFCFEVKTNEMSILLQAETLLELKSWLKVFDNEQTRILNSSNTDKESLIIASGRYPPIIAEFASTVNTTVDRELTNTTTTNSSGQVIVSSNLSSHIDKNEKYFQKHIYYQIPSIRPPFMTGTTKTSIIAYSLTIPTAIPTALTANIWGSVNWGIYYLHDSLDRNSSEESLNKPENELPYIPKESGIEPGINYPEYYPKDLVPLDIQMRALFETAVQPDEYCLVSFRCIWSPNSKQELSGRCFITSRHIYFYMLALGFVALFKDPVSHMVSVECNPQSQYDQLKIYNVDGVIKSKLFLDDGRLIQQKLVYLINNGVSDKPKSLPDLIGELNKIEIAVREENQDKRQLRLIDDLCKRVKKKEGVVSILENYDTTSFHTGTVPSLEPTTSPGVQFETNFTEEYQYSVEGTFGMPPKAVFHALLGDNAFLLKDQTSFARFPAMIREPWRKEENGDLFRSFNTTGMAINKKCLVHVEHLIDNMYHDEYYTFTQTESAFRFFLGSDFRVDYKFVILGISGKRSKVFLYARRTFSRNSIYNGFVNWLCHTLTYTKGGTFIKRLGAIEKEIGKHGMVAKAIYLYGKLSLTTVAKEPEKIPVNYCSLTDTLVIIGGIVKNFIVQFIVYAANLLVSGASLFIENVRMNYLLVLFCLLSMLINLFLVGRSSVSYWSVKNSHNLAYKYIRQEPILMQRAIYSQDVIDIIAKQRFMDENSNSSKCFRKFKNQSFVINYNQVVPWNTSYGDDVTKSMAKRLRQNIWEIGIKRHDLMVQLKSLNHMEKELALAEWKNWLMNEINRCSYVKSTIFNQVNDTSGNRQISNEIGDGMSVIMDYCNDCTSQLYNLDLL